jgi:S-adenosylmethionine synthetase
VVKCETCLPGTFLQQEDVIVASRQYLFTSESVSEGHPDKIADQISDAVLDAVYSQDPMGRVACEALVTTGLAFVAGEITTKCYVDIPTVAREVIRDVGYTRAEYRFDADSCSVLTAIQKQSSNIAMGVDIGGAGDQGLMFGYATKETPELMPAPISLAHKLVKRLTEVRRRAVLPYLRPDGKSQVTVEYVDGLPRRVDTVVISAQHDPDVTAERIRQDIIAHVIEPVIPKQWLDAGRITYHINPTGCFEIGGPHGDTGLTGRKIIVDTYGGVGRHGGGCFSGKDPTKVDRSASYMARYVAKNLAAAGLCEKVEVQLAYAIGVADPVSVMVDSMGTGVIPDEVMQDLVRRNFELTPAGIIKSLDLRRPIYRKTAAYGHFGRSEPEFTWERTDKADILRKEAGRLGA